MIRLDRFSPFHARSDEFGFRRVRPARAYFYVFPLGRRELQRLAYFFDYDYADGRDPQEYVAPVQYAAREWIAQRGAGPAAAPRLDATFGDGRLTIVDTRPAAVAPHHEFVGLPAQVYAHCDTAASVGSLARDCGVEEEDIRAILDDFDTRRLIARRADSALSLAVFRVRPASAEALPPPAVHATNTEATVA
jgi:hypothetical protein